LGATRLKRCAGGLRGSLFIHHKDTKVYKMIKLAVGCDAAMATTAAVLSMLSMLFWEKKLLCF
jgi:hypothetical protein